VATNPPTAPPAPAPDPSSKFNSTPTYMAVITELNVNQDQLTKRQKLIAEIEQSLSAKYKSANRLMSYVMRFGHPRTSMQTGDIQHIEAVLQSLAGAWSKWGANDVRRDLVSGRRPRAGVAAD